MTSEEPTTELPQPEDKVQEAVQEDQTGSDNLPDDLRPSSNQSTSSGYTEESLAAYAYQTLRTLASLDSSLDISFLPAPENTSQLDGDTSKPQMASELELLEREGTGLQQSVENIQGTSNTFSTRGWPQDNGRDYFATDTSEVE